MAADQAPVLLAADRIVAQATPESILSQSNLVSRSCAGRKLRFHLIRGISRADWDIYDPGERKSTVSARVLVPATRHIVLECIPQEGSSMNSPPTIDPDYSPAQREEILCIDYLLGELRALRDRGIVTPESVSVVEAEKASRRAEIERLGMTAGALRASRALMGSRPREALALAEQARALAPDQVDTWALSAEISSLLGEFERAIALCREAVDVHGHVALEAKIAAYAAEGERRARAAALADGAARARAAMSRGDHESALAAAREVLGHAPLHAEALAISIRSLSALGRLDEAEAACAALRQVRPGEAADWAERIRASAPAWRPRPVPCRGPRRT